MATIHVCDECGERLGRFALRIEPTTGLDSDVTFLDGSWNGGVFCSVACARNVLAAVRDPIVAGEPDDPEGFQRGRDEEAAS